MMSRNFGHFLTHLPQRHAIYYEASALLSQNPRPPHPKTMTSFMDDPFADLYVEIIH
jgi:hypothetical protein